MKNAKLLWRILGYVLIPALFFCFGNSLRAQTQYTRVTSLADLEDGTYVILDRQNSKGQHLLLMTSRDTKDYKGEEIRSTDANSTDVEYKDVDDFAGFTPVEIRIEKSGNFYTLKDLSDGKYLSANTSATSGGKENLSVQDEVFYWEISASNGIRPVGSDGTVSTNHIVGMYGTTTQTFSAYKSGTSGNISLYKKQEVAATCDPVTNVQETVTATSVTLTWTAPATVPANGYEVIITDINDDSEVVKTTVNEPTYTCNSLQADWGYEYSIKSLCSATSESTAVTGEFETPEANAKGLSVTLSGDMEGDKYTGPVTFTFTIANFDLGMDGRVKYYIIDEEAAEVASGYTAEETYTHTFTPGSYEAKFELVGNDNTSLTPKVEVQKEFTVKLPKAKAPEFTPATQAAAFTTAQTITLSSQTAEASFFYRIGDEGEFAAYPAAGIVLNETGTFEVSAFATKTGMENSDTITKTYTLKLPLHIDGIVVFEKTFTSKDLDAGWTSGSIYYEKPANENESCIRLAKSGESGWIQLPEKPLLNKFTLYLTAGSYNADATNLKITVSVDGEEVGESTISSLLSSKLDEYAVPFTIEGANVVKATIKISGSSAGNNARFYLQTIKIYQATETPEECNPVEGLGDNNQIVGTTANITWETPDPAPQIGYAIKVNTDDDANTLVKDVTVDASATSYSVTDLTQGTDYVFSITTLCSAKASSDPTVLHFTVPVPGQPSITIVKPNPGTITRDSVMFIYKVDNFKLKGDDAQGSVKYTLRGTNLTAPITNTVTDTFFYHKFARSGKDTVLLELVDKTGVSLATPVKARQYFTIDLPNVERPVFAPEATTSTSAVDVTISCATQGATVYYSLNDAAYVPYSAPIKLTDLGTYAFKAFAVKEKMDTSAIASKTYTIKAPYDETVADLSALRAGTQNKIYKITGEVILTAKSSNRNYKWIQDANAGILIDDNTGLVTNSYEIGDGITGVIGKLSSYSGQLQLVMIGNLPEATTHNNVITPIELTVSQLTEGINTYCSRVVELSGLTLEDPSLTEGKWKEGTSYTAKDRNGNSVVIYTSVKDGDFVGEDLPQGKFNLVGMAGKYNTQIQIIPRSKADIEELAACQQVSELSSDVNGTTVTFSWAAPASAPEVGYAIDVFNAANTLIKRDTVKNPATLTYTLENLAEGEYTYEVMTLCSADDASEPVTDNFEIVAEGKPSIQIVKPNAGEFPRDSVMFIYKVNNFKLKGDDAEGSVKYTLRGTNLTAPVTATITDTFFYYKFDRSGKDTVILELVDKNGASLETPVKRNKAFVINLPDVATPTFTPTATSATEPIEVTIDCETKDASIFYSLNNADYVAYTGAIKLEEAGTYAFKAFAAKAKMDTSKIATKTYTLKIAKPLEPGVVFYEPFDNLENAGGGVLDAKLDDYTELPGWTGEVVYMQVAGIVKMGSSKVNGYLQTPAIALTEGDTYILSFDAQAWNKDSDKLTVTINGTDYEITGLANDENTGTNNAPTKMKTFEKEFTAAAATTIRFASNGTEGKARFFLDNIKVSEMTDEPHLSVSSSKFEMNTVMGTPVSQKVTVNGRNLAADVTVTCLQENNTFSVSAESLTKEAVMGENGAELTVTFNASVAEDSAKIQLACGDLLETIMVRAFAASIVEVENLAALRAGELTTTNYKVKGEVVVTAVDGNSTWVQDASAAILIYGATGNTYAVGDGITGIFGTLKNYSGLIELIPGGDQPAATTHDNKVEPQEMTVEELNEKGAEYSSRLIRINGLTLSDPEATDGKWKGGSSYTATDEAGNEITIRTTLSTGSYIGEALPKGKFDLISIAGIYNSTVQVSPRVKEDIIEAEVDPCDAPTRLKATVVDNNVTLTWEGAAEKYRVVVRLDKDTVCNELVEAKSRELKNLAVGVYSWSVASVCENGEEVANGDNFEVKKQSSANEDAEGLAFRIYPNPTTGVFYVEVAESARMEIFTVGGVMIRNAELTEGKNEIRLDRSGIYFVRLTNAHGAAVNRVIVR